jgi:mono/diheme cytochrome c family protein
METISFRRRSPELLQVKLGFQTQMRIRSLSLLATGCVWLAICLNSSTLRAASRPPNQDASGPAQNQPGYKAYAANCAICHGDHLEGDLPSFPPLVGVEHHMNDAQIVAVIQQGKDRMPGFPDLKGEELKDLMSYLRSSSDSAAKPAAGISSSNASNGAIEAGGALFQQSCAFCHGRDAMGGETGPDLTQSKIVHADVDGDKISEVVRNGRPEKKMPAFNFSAPELQSLVAFIHAQAAHAVASKGGRRGVSVEDLQTGNADAGKLYFNGAGTCAQCHSATGDLAGIASRFNGLALEQRMLYPEDVKSKVTVTLSSGKHIAGILDYLDEFTLGMRDESGTYHSWPVERIKYKVFSPVDAHVELFPKYTDADIHNLMAYLQTLR